MLDGANSSAFRGLKYLTFDALGNCYFTDAGHTGMHDPSGRVFRLGAGGEISAQLDVLLSNLPGPSGIALDARGEQLFVSAARGSAIWRGDLKADGTVSRVGVLRGFFGDGGPNGMAVDATRHLVVAHARLGCAFIVNMWVEVTHAVQAHDLRSVTSVAFRPGTEELVLIDSEQGVVWTATMPDRGVGMFSHG